MRLFFLLIIGLFFWDGAHASIVLNGTRIIYPEGVPEVSLLATNQGGRPFAAQVWIDHEGDESSPDTKGKLQAPFFVTPAISRLAPNVGQSIRIVYTGENLPIDRETVFYFNLLQIPPVAVEDVGKNIFQVMVKDRLKLFYRPSGVLGSSADVKDKINFSLVSEGGRSAVKVENPTGFYASFAGVKLNSAGESFPVEYSMVPPFSEQTWVVSKSASGLRGGKLVFEFVNDYGGFVTVTREL